LQDGRVQNADLVIYAIGITPRDELAKAAGIECHPRGGVVVNDNLQTSVQDIYAIGECANWKGKFHGLIAPRSMLYLLACCVSFLIAVVEMVDILLFNLTQTESHALRIMNSPDLSTKLK
jgi:nitrite reductase (NAD(P)H)